MKRTFVWSTLILALCSMPAFAGTVYVPVLSDNGIDDSGYVTRVWLTNEGNGPQEVETLFIPMGADGTAGRDDGPGPDTMTVRAGETSVLEIDGGSGLLEITSTGEGVGNLAINAELRNIELDAARVTHSIPPVLWSENVRDGGESLTLQGLRRTENGVYTNVILVNLGHAETQCAVDVVRAGGGKVAGTALLNLAPLSQVQFPDGLGILGLSRGSDINAQISCDQPFYAYLTVYERESGEVIFIRPSASDDSTLRPPGKDVPSVPGAVLFTRPGVFHTPTPGQPSKIYNIPVPGDRSYSNVVVDFDFYHGGWYARDPSGLHSLVWLHRGACCWPKWQGNITVFANVFGPGKNLLRMISNMDLPQYQATNGGKNYALQPGQTYHAHFEYATDLGIAFMEVSLGGEVVVRFTMPTTTDRLRPDHSETWMIYFGHQDEYYSQHGPERPSYGWRYQNLRVEFLP